MDEFKSYKWVIKEYPHRVVRHSFGEYVGGNAYTNTAEGYFSILKRGINGIYHHVSKKHLHRYLNEFDFRYNMRKAEDQVVTSMCINNIEGKMLFYQDSCPQKRVI